MSTILVIWYAGLCVGLATLAIQGRPMRPRALFAVACIAPLLPLLVVFDAIRLLVRGYDD